jgi:hypothetical protein
MINRFHLGNECIMIVYVIKSWIMIHDRIMKRKHFVFIIFLSTYIIEITYFKFFNLGDNKPYFFILISSDFELNIIHS